MNILLIVLEIGLVWILFMFFNWAWVTIQGKSRGKIVKADEFAKLLAQENGQLIDVREKEPYKRSHILGARSMPAINFSQGRSGLRHDRDIFLYGNNLGSAVRVAGRLRKEGVPKDKLYMLKGGYQQYQGRKIK
ncbi:rhodanese-like domain-containing protein [Eupransor demetentiae]|uniref:Rhodanese-related sulfurtransferase (PspE) n=1 Tax=Eupransor demetentiae TaxID=3109584 RepID=A0ABP0ESS6_9LACO|nr:Rhodanese-related sulfurtransferase (PspE) [Lactobacillaceae bacterium LMG 33000]